MKISYNWLKDYCKHGLSVEKLAESLTNAGLVVDTVSPVEDDFCLEVEVTSNRPDCLGFIGVAREVATIVRGKLDIPDVGYDTMDENINDITSVTVEDNELCRRYTARIIKDVKIGPSPGWLQKKISSIGLRPVNNIVDITNYVLMESGQPLHAFDFNKLSESRIVVRRAKKAETMEAIDGSKCTLTDDMLVIADFQKPVAIAGIMGGKDTEVSDTTRNILLESAFFDPRSVRRVSRKLGLVSDSSYRFERRVDPECVDWASRRATKMILEIAGGQAVEGVIDQNYLEDKKVCVTLKMSHLNRLLGLQIEKDTAKDILGHLQFSINSETEDGFSVDVPSFRGDVYREIDLIEEVARIHGYDKIPIKSNIGVKLTQDNQFDKITEKTKNVISGLGFNEVITDSIVGDSQNRHGTLWSETSSLKILNPIRQDEDLLRKALVHNLLRVKKHNQNYGVEKTDIYELSKVYLPKEDDQLPEEKECLCLLGEEGYLALKGVIETILNHLNIADSLESTHFNFGLFCPEKSAELRLGDSVLGFIGELSKEVISDYGFRSKPCVAELDFNILIDKTNLESSYRKIPSFPVVTRDLAVVTDEDVTWADIKRCIESLKIDYVDDIEFFDVYRGKQIERGRKSIAFRITFRADDKTLKSDEVDILKEKILTNLSNSLGVNLRA
ncbi:MAG: phenylalanine--tRNA ligase subunit beta [Candidatus Scalindua rubra]|uniref:Phenylalanine--tRNA ligase beta subunit n=1 Tax=Candidatus Scalindua brodae TaxID=237368 RepID=A0A0B0EJZ4_9BACT|nr:MAG: phenylalanyl-tRNA synthase beta subunit [Candidatus Scalindua brodae]MBZ0110246.1 phenylalanine--tRNA ligase subunit beta [Candidatus Scalindua rubra]TWU35451.1 Phenylalanine--tRNA ligase beta subunit [Candidatus Brocadiaceae bacterium S225]